MNSSLRGITNSTATVFLIHLPFPDLSMMIHLQDSSSQQLASLSTLLLASSTFIVSKSFLMLSRDPLRLFAMYSPPSSRVRVHNHRSDVDSAWLQAFQCFPSLLGWSPNLSLWLFPCQGWASLLLHLLSSSPHFLGSQCSSSGGLLNCSRTPWHLPSSDTLSVCTALWVVTFTK